MNVERALKKKKQKDTRDDILNLLKACGIEKKLGKQVNRVPIPLKIGRDTYFMVFEPPAKVEDLNFDAWTVTVKMRAALYTGLADIPDRRGSARIQYNIAYDVVKDQLQFRGAAIHEMSFAQKIRPAIQKAMKKKAGKLNLNLDVKDCF